MSKSKNAYIYRIFDPVFFGEAIEVTKATELERFYRSFFIYGTYFPYLLPYVRGIILYLEKEN